ncbi:hypothetical protein [Neobacillus sp. PS2-9]|uniref:hypothetical protein n=1 Tax=Neobacillus sp. PS2-9 TaxID=3070676 RepID=UPI0027E1DA24|nr:hypothetical protein [Neobacillus sp. PS2-9]WML57079.1 hypothetical protein RCG25_19425 [Neobacillus sp. PS2-9]
MFNEYTVFKMMKLRQEETERNARDTWNKYVEMEGENNAKEGTFLVKPSVNQCCPCACA